MSAKLPAWDVGDSSIDNDKQATSPGAQEEEARPAATHSANGGSASKDSQQTTSDAEKKYVTKFIDVRLTCWMALGERMVVIAQHMAFEAAENEVLARHNALLALDLHRHTVPGWTGLRTCRATWADFAVLGSEVHRRRKLVDWLHQRYQDMVDQNTLLDADAHSLRARADSLLLGLFPDESRFNKAQSSIRNLAEAMRKAATLLSTEPIRCVEAQAEIQEMLQVPGEFHPPASWQMGMEEWYLSTRLQEEQ